MREKVNALSNSAPTTRRDAPTTQERKSEIAFSIKRSRVIGTGGTSDQGRTQQETVIRAHAKALFYVIISELAYVSRDAFPPQRDHAHARVVSKGPF